KFYNVQIVYDPNWRGISLFIGVESDFLLSTFVIFNVISRLGSFIVIINALTGEAPENSGLRLEDVMKVKFISKNNERILGNIKEDWFSNKIHDTDGKDNPTLDLELNLVMRKGNELSYFVLSKKNEETWNSSWQAQILRFIE
ncbi:3634_t:CDS:2, partial [Funneliformis geosporum]